MVSHVGMLIIVLRVVRTHNGRHEGGTSASLQSGRDMYGAHRKEELPGATKIWLTAVAEQCRQRWQRVNALKGDDASLSPATGFTALDDDCVRAVAATLSAAESASRSAVSLDRRSQGVAALSMTCKSVRAMCTDTMRALRSVHDARVRELSGLLVRLGTSLDAVRAARTLFYLPGQSI